MAIYKRGRGVELGSTVKQFQLLVRAGLEPATYGFQDPRPNHSTTLLPFNSKCIGEVGRLMLDNLRKVEILQFL